MGTIIKYFSILYYYGEYRLCQTRIYQTQVSATMEQEAKILFKELKPGAKIKRIEESE